MTHHTGTSSAACKSWVSAAETCASVGDG
jgi:hypothetical protein